MGKELTNVIIALSHSNIPFKSIIAMVEELEEQYEEPTVVEELKKIGEAIHEFKSE